MRKANMILVLSSFFIVMWFVNNWNSWVITSRTLKNVDYLKTMNKIIPRWDIINIIANTIPEKSPLWWRPRSDLEVLLKMTLLQQWYNLSDEWVEENVYDRYSFQLFCDINIWDTVVPDATTICRFRKHCTENKLNEKIFKIINKKLKSKWIICKQWTIVDATILPASWSTKNKDKSRDPEMHSTKKWSNYYFWWKAHIGVDDTSWIATAMSFTAANVHDSQEFEWLLHWEEERVYWDSAYYSKDRKEEYEGKWIAFNVNKRWNLTRKDEFFNRFFSKRRSKVEHIFWIIKDIRWHRRVKYKWILKNEQQWYLLLWLANLYKVRKTFAI
jgi:IS5 family transposase